MACHFCKPALNVIQEPSKISWCWKIRGFGEKSEIFGDSPMDEA